MPHDKSPTPRAGIPATGPIGVEQNFRGIDGRLGIARHNKSAQEFGNRREWQQAMAALFPETGWVRSPDGVRLFMKSP